MHGEKKDTLEAEKTRLHGSEEGGKSSAASPGRGKESDGTDRGVVGEEERSYLTVGRRRKEQGWKLDEEVNAHSRLSHVKHKKKKKKQRLTHHEFSRV